MAAGTLHPGLSGISQLFSYPAAKSAAVFIPKDLHDAAKTLLIEMQGLDPIRLENEYIRLFVNAMPEVPCAPYGSVYLEGSVMGESTLTIAAIYKKYGIASEEPADHIAVESEFLAWLHGVAREDEAAAKDFAFLLGHFRQWTDSFFDQVIKHDQLGCYRRAAELARAVLAALG